MQFDVRLNRRDDADDVPYFIELQSDRANLMAVRIVAPLMRKSVFRSTPRLQPELRVNDQVVLLVIHELFAIDARALGPVVANLGSEHDRIIAALDFLFTGV